ncbi:hypothetical protein M3Y97_01057700 [Aphelenchoides bicaudatus]|nr:hypothetical protein M3Y97_01057700 [Aphelenchoides bicaudatus]
MSVKFYCLGSVSAVVLILFFVASNADARAYKQGAYKYDTLLNPIARLYYKQHKKTALRSIFPSELDDSAEMVVIRESPPPRKQQKIEIAVPNETFGLNEIRQRKDPNLQAFRVDFVQVPVTTTEQPTMRRTMKKILHRMRY